MHVPSFSHVFEATQLRSRIHSLCMKLYYLAKNAVAAYQIIVICCKVINFFFFFFYCLLGTYSILHDEIFEPEFLFLKRKISPAVISQRVTVKRFL